MKWAWRKRYGRSPSQSTPSHGAAMRRTATWVSSRIPIGESRSRATLVPHRTLQERGAPQQQLGADQEEGDADDSDDDIADRRGPPRRRLPALREARGAVEDAVPLGGAFLAQGLAAGHAQGVAVPVRMVRALRLFQGHGTLPLPRSIPSVYPAPGASIKEFSVGYTSLTL